MKKHQSYFLEIINKFSWIIIILRSRISQLRDNDYARNPPSSLKIPHRKKDKFENQNIYSNLAIYIYKDIEHRRFHFDSIFWNIKSTREGGTICHNSSHFSFFWQFLKWNSEICSISNIIILVIVLLKEFRSNCIFDIFLGFTLFPLGLSICL